MKSTEELRVELTEDIRLKDVIRLAVKKFSTKDTTHGAKLYNKNGVLLFESDFNLLASGDILYVALKGEDFSYAAILDDYEIGKTLGIGGFGKVVLGKHR